MTDIDLALTNLDFEYELDSGNRYKAPRLMNKMSLRWRFIQRLLPNMKQAECLDPTDFSRPESQQNARDLNLWGVTPKTSVLAESLGMSGRFPPVDVVRQVNDKRYSHNLEKILGLELPHSQIVGSLEELADCVEACPYDWVLKHPLGVSGRERVVGKCQQLEPSAKGWAKRRLKAGLGLVFEPWVQRQSEYSHHFQISQDGTIQFLGRCALVTDPGGVHRGNRVVPTAAVDDYSFSRAQVIARILALRGYWGPVGIDGFSGHLGGETIRRPLVEINARCSFGRLALALVDWLPSDWCYFWWHPSVSERQRIDRTFEALPEPGTDEVRAGTYRLPEIADPQGQSGTVLMVAPNPVELRRVEQEFPREVGLS